MWFLNPHHGTGSRPKPYPSEFHRETLNPISKKKIWGLIKKYGVNISGPSFFKPLFEPPLNPHRKSRITHAFCEWCPPNGFFNFFVGFMISETTWGFTGVHQKKCGSWTHTMGPNPHGGEPGGVRKTQKPPGAPHTKRTGTAKLGNTVAHSYWTSNSYQVLNLL